MWTICDRVCFHLWEIPTNPKFHWFGHKWSMSAWVISSCFFLSSRGNLLFDLVRMCLNKMKPLKTQAYWMNGFVLSAGAECLLGPWQGLTEDKGRGVEGGHDSGHDLGFVLVRQQSKPSSSTCLSVGVSNCKNQKSVKSAGYLSLKVTERYWTAVLEAFANWFEDLSNLPKSAQSGWKAQHRCRMKFQGARAGIPAFCFSLGWCATEETMY